MEQLRKYRRLKGYRYFNEAIATIDQDPELLHKVMCVYKAIADKHGVSTDSVRFAIARFLTKVGNGERPREQIIKYVNNRKL